MTRLEEFIKLTHIKPNELADTARISRQHLLRIRRGSGLTMQVAARLTMACAIILRRLVDPDELFNLAQIGRDKGGRAQGPKRAKKRRRA